MVRSSILALALLLLLAVPAAARPGFLGSGGAATSSGSGGTVVNTETFHNAGASTTPGGTGVRFPANVFSNTKPGDVPSGSIAVPTVGGVAVPYEAYDCARTWADGSQRGCAYALFLPQLAAGAEEQVTWTETTGSYSNTSSVTPATVAAISDYKLVASGVNTTWINFRGVPTGTQIGFSTSGGAVTSGAVRISPQVGTGVFGINCSNSGGTCVNPSNYSYTTASAPTSPYTTLTLTAAVATAVSNNNGNLLAYDLTTPSAIPAGTTATVSGAAVTLSAASPTVGSGDTIAFAYPIQGCSTTPAGYTVNQTGNFVTGVNVIGGGSGCATVGSGNQTFDANVYLNAYGSIKPPTTASAGGAASFTATYSAGSIATSGVTGTISVGQLVQDSTGALAVITGGSGSLWTVSAALTSGAMTANCPIQQYADGPVMTGYKIFGPFVDSGTGAADPWHRATVYLEYWHNGGATDSVRAIAMVDDTIYTPGQSAPSYTYDADIKNGTAEIRGNAAGLGPYTRLTLNTSGAWFTGDPALSGPVGASGRPDWLGVTPNAFSESFSLGINSVIVALTTADKVYWHANRAHMPLTNSIVPSPTVIPNSGNYGYPTGWVGYYQPYGVPFIDTQGSWTGGGEHFFLAPDSAHLAFWYLSTDIASDRGASWLQQLRVAGIQLMGAQEGPRWDDTWHAVDVDPSWSQPAANTDPAYLFANTRTGYDSRSFGQGGQSSLSNAAQVQPGDATHWPVGLPAAIYTVEGDRFMLDNVDLNASNMMMGQFDDFNRTANIGGTQWYALYYGESSANIRATGWSSIGISDAAILLPPAEPDSQWWAHVVANNVAFEAAFIPYTGTVGRGCNGTTSCTGQGSTGTKSFDTSPMGTTVSPVSYTSYGGLVNTGFSPFEEGYVGEATDKLAMQWDGALPNLTTMYNYEVSANYVANAAANTCAYNISSYDLAWGSTVTGQPFAGWDATDVSTPQRGNIDYLSDNADINTVAGSSVVYANSQPGTNLGAVKFTAATTGAGSNVIVSGSASAALPNAIISDITTPSAIPVGTYVTATPTGSSIPISASISGITAGDQIGVSQVLDYPNGSNVIRPAGSLAMFTNIDYQGEGTPNPETIGAFPPPTTPSGGVDDTHFLVWCPDASGAAKGTLNPLGTNCASPAPITFSANGRYRMIWIVNQTCPSVTAGTWNGQDYQSYQGRLAQFWAIARGANALAPTSNTALALSHTTPSVSPLNTTFSANPRVAWDDHF